MANDGGIVVLVVGFLLGYLLALMSPAMRRALPRRRRSRTRSRARRLDPSGFTAEGAHIDVSGAVARCKVSGQVEMTVAGGGPAQGSLDLDPAPAGAGDKE
jgi:hypothetical protein